MWNDALSVVETGKDMHNRPWFQPLYISYGDYKLPVSILLTSLFARVTNSAAVAVRLPNLFAGLSIVAAGFAIWQYMPRFQYRQRAFLGIITAFLLAIIPWSWHFSSVGFESFVSASFVSWSMVALLASMQQKRLRWRTMLVALAVFLGTVSVYTYFSSRFVWPFVFVTFVGVSWKYTARAWWLYLLGLVLWALSLFPMMQADFYDASNQLRLSTQSILTMESTQQPAINALRLQSGNTFFSKVLYNRATVVGAALAQNMAEHLDPGFLFLTGDEKPRHGVPGFGLFYAVLAPFLVVGLISVWRRSWQLGVGLLVWWAFALLPASVPTDVPHALRSLNAILPLSMLLALGVWVSAEYIGEQKWSTWWRLSIVAVVCGVFALQVSAYAFTRNTVYATVSAEAWQAGYTPLAEYVARERDAYDQVYIQMFDDRWYLYYQPMSGLSWSEIQTLPSDGFKRQQLGVVTILTLNTEEMEALAQEPLSYLLVVEQSQLELVPSTWQEIDRIQDETGKERFVVFTSMDS